MANQNPSPKTRFKNNPEQLADKPIAVRLPVDIDQQVRERGGEWIRKVLREALQQEGERG